MALTKYELENLIAEAVSALQQGNLTAANVAANRGINAGAEHPFLLKVHALCLHATGEYRDALRAFHHARSLDPNDPSTLNGIAGCLAGMGAYKPALAITDESLRLLPNTAATYQLRGWILELLGDLPGARKAYERAIDISPDFPDASAGVALVAALTKDYKASRAYATRVLAKVPQQPTAIIALAMTDTAQGEATSAEKALRGVIGADALPNRIKALAWGALADALEAQQRMDDASAARATKDELLRAEPTQIDAPPDEFASL